MEKKLKEKAQERGGIPAFLVHLPNVLTSTGSLPQLPPKDYTLQNSISEDVLDNRMKGALASPLYNPNKDSKKWKAVFDRGHYELNVAIIDLLRYTALHIVYVDLKEVMVDSLYLGDLLESGASTTNNSRMKLQTRTTITRNFKEIGMSPLVPILNGIIEEIFGFVVADRVLRSDGRLVDDLDDSIDCVARQLVLCLFREILDIFEAIIIMDLHSARTFIPKDINNLLIDIDVSYLIIIRFSLEFFVSQDKRQK